MQLPSFRSITAAILAASVLGLQAAELHSPLTRRRIIQPVHEYFSIADLRISPTDGSRLLNGFQNYTHIGTDFGFLGPGEVHCIKQPGMICAELPQHPDGWAGMWHSLNGLARENRPLDLQACYPPMIAAPFQPRVTGVRATVKGEGRFKLELLPGAQSGKPWAQTFSLSQSPATHTLAAAVEPAVLGRAQHLTWVAEPGSRLCVDQVAIEVELPPVDFPEYVLLASYAKFARCYSEVTGFVRDRAHIMDTALNNIPATGMFALATVAAVDAGFVEREQARSILRKIHSSLAELPRERGLLPHFVEHHEGRWRPLPGSEFSTIDTALCLFGLRIAALALDEAAIAEAALQWFRGIAMDDLRDADGYVLHGIRDDGKPLAHVWRDWGGETALVLMMQRIAAGPAVVPRMEDSGRTHRGIGFISELPSLFFPKYNTNAIVRAGCVDWRAYREYRLAQQKAYFPTNAPGSMAAKMGLYGLSAGEGSQGRRYHVAGVEDPGEQLVFPHYILMSGMLESDSSAVYSLLQHIEVNGWLPPWGLVENIEVDGSGYLAMLGSLNAAFETLSAYHLLKHHRRQGNLVYLTATRDPVLLDAHLAVFDAEPPAPPLPPR